MRVREEMVEVTITEMVEMTITFDDTFNNTFKEATVKVSVGSICL